MCCVNIQVLSRLQLRAASWTTLSSRLYNSSACMHCRLTFQFTVAVFQKPNLQGILERTNEKPRISGTYDEFKTNFGQLIINNNDIYCTEIGTL